MRSEICPFDLYIKYHIFSMSFRGAFHAALALTKLSPSLTLTEFRAENDLIASMEASQTRGAANYEPFTALYLTEVDIVELVADHVCGDLEALLQQYPSFGNLPLTAQIALWDMIYNLDPTGLAQFTRMTPAIVQGASGHAIRGIPTRGVSL